MPPSTLKNVSLWLPLSPSASKVLLTEDFHHIQDNTGGCKNCICLLHVCHGNLHCILPACIVSFPSHFWIFQTGASQRHCSNQFPSLQTLLKRESKIKCVNLSLNTSLRAVSTKNKETNQPRWKWHLFPAAILSALKVNKFQWNVVLNDHIHGLSLARQQWYLGLLENDISHNCRAGITSSHCCSDQDHCQF